MKLFERHDLRLWLLESMWAQSIQRIQGALSACNLMLRFGDMSAKERELRLDSTLSTDREIQFVGALSEPLRQLVRCWMLLHIFAVSTSPCHIHGKLTKSNWSNHQILSHTSFANDFWYFGASTWMLCDFCDFPLPFFARRFRPGLCRNPVSQLALGPAMASSPSFTFEDTFLGVP